MKHKDSMIRYRVTTVESERGWGQSYEYDYFKTREEAQGYMDRVNARNTAPTAPDWYMSCPYDIKVVELDEDGKEV